MNNLVPSQSLPNGLTALEAVFGEALSVSAAVAFVTESGVRHLAELLDRSGPAELEIIARAGGVTSPDALLALRDQLGVQVSVVIGRGASEFHPKLWLARSPAQLSILSGSGNLTEGALLENQEQFELYQVPAESEAAQEQEDRFDRLTANAVRLDEVLDTTTWQEWLTTITKERMHRRELARLEAQLSTRQVRPSRKQDRAQLIADLMELYELTVAANLSTKSGWHYVPTRFLQGIRRAEEGGDPVQLVYRICQYQTDGFNVILDADRPDLTVESLVVDASKPYHDLFTDTTQAISAKRLAQFPSWPQAD